MTLATPLPSLAGESYLPKVLDDLPRRRATNHATYADQGSALESSDDNRRNVQHNLNGNTQRDLLTSYVTGMVSKISLQRAVLLACQAV